METSTAYLRYLVAIHELSAQGREVSSTEVARVLGVKKPSVTHMLESMGKRGLVEKERYGKIALTSAGADLAGRFRKQIEGICVFFPRMGLKLERGEALLAATALLAALPERYQDVALRESEL